MVSVDEWKQTRLYMKLITAPVGEDLESMASKIASKYRFDLGSDLEALRARIRSDENMNEDDRFIIECYISEKKDGKKILPQEVSE